ncbi:MAG: ATP-binding cassette domain-containing protein [Acidobacteriota bacterium]|nr:ATP-binding cassette domain-containing protein [Acidobacteriota bacterium]
MIQLSSAGKHFGDKVLFEGLDWLINPRERVGLVGGNGAGKTTLLKALAGLEPLDRGAISSAKGLTTGYLPQDGLSLSGRTVLAECLSVFSDLLEMEKEMETLTHQMAELDPEGEEYARVADRYHRVQTEFHGRDGYTLEAQAGAVLNGLGFSRDDWSRPTEEFSGGWQMRLALAKLLLIKPNLLLLDEPTNHLDIEARNWLEEYLKDYPNAVVVVSHDRYFLDVTVTKILELWNRRGWFYTGNYDRYLAQKADRQAQLQAAWRNQQDRITQLEVFINRFRYQATKAKQVQSRIKELEKIERIEVPPEEKAIHFKFPQPPASGRQVAEFRAVAKSYGEKLVFKGVDFVVNRGDRVALVGVNGAGKSTLIKLLAGAEALTAGEYRRGHKVETDYFAQDQYKALDPEARLIDDLASVAPGAMSGQTQLRTLLGSFLFSNDEVFKRIGVLSGGERNRYALARMLLTPSNFLLLDEPTNHLDLRAKDVLLDALREFTGTLVFVSHDRYFIDKLATRVFEIEGASLRDYPGNYEDYLWQKEGRGAAQPQPVEAAAPKHERKPQPRKGKKVNPILIRQTQARRRELEEKIAECEGEIRAAENDLANYKNAEASVRSAKLLNERRNELRAMMQEWEQIAAELEEPGVPTSVLP